MDNGNDRCYATPEGCHETDPVPPPAYTRGAIFKIDETAMQARPSIPRTGAGERPVWPGDRVAMKVLQGGTYRSYRIRSLYPGVIWSE